MKQPLLFFPVLAAVFLACPGTFRGAIALDFGATSHDLQTAFQSVSGSATGNAANPLVVPAGALPDGETVSILSSSVLNFRDRGNITNANYAPYADLYEDYLRAGNGIAVNAATNPFSTLTINVGQLLPLSEYRVTIRIYDGAIAAASAGSYSFTISGTGDINPANNTYGTTFHSNATPFPGLAVEERSGYSEIFLSDALGNLQLTITQSSGVENTVPMNSFELEMIPEPASAFLICIAGVPMLCKRRRSI